MIRPSSKFSPFFRIPRETVFAFDGEVSFGFSPESQEAVARTPSTEVAINLVPEHAEAVAFAVASEVVVALVPEHAEAVAFAETVEASFMFTPEHEESRTLAEAGEVLLALQPEHLESMGVVILGTASVNLEAIAELAFSLGVLADLGFSLAPEAVSKMTSLDEFFKAYSAILYKDSVTGTLTPTHPRIVELARQRVGA